MARAAAKRNKRTRQAARPAGRVTAAAPPPRRRPDYESQLFFGRIRRQAKPVFIFLAVVFAISFAFLGVGSGSGALNDIFTFNWFGSGPPDPVKQLQKKIAKDPTNPTLRRDLATTLHSRGRIDEAVTAYESWVKLRPNSVSALSSLATEYGNQAQSLGTQVQQPPIPPLAALGAFSLAPQSSTLGQALESQVPALFSITSLQQAEAGQFLKERRHVYDKRIATFRKLATIQPQEPGWVFQVADTTRLAGLRTAAIKRYQEFIKRFPDAPDVGLAKDYIKQLESATPTSTGTATTTSTG